MYFIVKKNFKFIARLIRKFDLLFRKQKKIEDVVLKKKLNLYNGNLNP